MEKHLRSTIEAAKSSELRSGSTLTSISEDSDWVYATYIDSTGEERHVRARFLVGADGKTGFTRKMYMEPKGVKLECANKYSLGPFPPSGISQLKLKLLLEQNIKSLGLP